MRALVLAALVAFPAYAQEAPDSSPRPEARPDPEDRMDTDAALSEVDAAEPAEAQPEGREAAPGIYRQLAETEEELSACLARLDALGATYVLADPVAGDDPDCGIVNPVALSSPAPEVEMSEPVTIRCKTAVALARWTQNHLMPAADALGRGSLVRLDQAGGYQCRRRNNLPDGKLSEHSFGNAVDIVGFRFADGEPIAVEPREEDGTLAEAYQRAARAASCLYFTTVLGPGTDAAHADHIHADVKERRGGYRLCQ